MALTSFVPFWSTRLTLAGGVKLLTAPRHPEIAWLDAAPESLASVFSRASDKRWSREGSFLPWLDVAPALSLQAESLEMSLVPPKDSPLPSPLQLRFDVALGEGAGGMWVGFVPALGVGASGKDAAGVRDNLRAAIRLEFLRRDRLKDAHDVLSAQWFTEVSLVRSDAEASFYTFSELRAFREAEREERLPKVATRLSPHRRRVFEVDAPLAELVRAVSSPYSRCVLLVGPAGVGKTALVEELARTRPAALGTANLWETAAARMERVLTDSNGWQDNLSQVCAELTERKDWLYVRNLAELFEVGRYVGNKVSMGEYLRPRLSAGELSFISECTPEQLARLEARYPGSLDSFRKITIEAPAHSALVRICQARTSAEAGGMKVDGRAIDELLRLQRRFSPYSGFPGKPVRFLEALALSQRTAQAPIDRDAVLARFCAETGMPRSLIDPQVPLTASDITAHFTAQVFGQGDAIAAVVEALVSIRAGLSRPKRPISTLLFVGPTGVGKTETAKSLAAFMFGSRDRMVRLDMSEYATPGAALRLTDGPGGEGRLTAAIRRQPFSVVLFDEIEKAHPMVFDLLLQVLGEGRLSDGRGQTADFCSSIIILTSNIGAAEASVAPTGFTRRGGRAASLQAVYTAAAERHFRPEFFNRLDRVVAFAPLGRAAIGRVLDRELLALERRPGIRLRRASLRLSEGAREHLAQAGYDPTYGARHLQRALRSQARAPIARALNAQPCENPVDLELVLRENTLDCVLTERAPGKVAQSALARFEEVADKIDAERRFARQVADGSRYAALLSTLQRLARRQKRLGDRFWQDAEAAATFGRLQQVDTQCRDMLSAILELSTECTLSAMEDEPMPDLYAESLADYRTQAGAAQRLLFDTMATSGTTVTLGLYGAAALTEQHAAAYAEACAALSLSVRSRRLWLRKSPDQRGIPNRLPDNKAEREKVIADRDQIYAVLPLDAEPAADCERPLGVELEVVGAGAWALLEPEGGVFCHDDLSEQPRLRVAFTGKPWATFDEKGLRLEDVHRRSIIEEPPRRFVGSGRVHDKPLRLTVPKPLPVFLAALLRERFEKLLREDLSS